MYSGVFCCVSYTWLPVHRRVEFKIACLVHQSLASLAPTYLTTDIHLVSEYGRHPLSSSTDRTLTVPRTDNRFGDRSFAVAGPRLSNSLPISLRQISSYGQFRRYLKNHLGFDKSQHSVTHDSLCYINILTYFLTFNLSVTNCNAYSTYVRLGWRKKASNMFYLYLNCLLYTSDAADE